jgi:hypothetical protein
MDTAGALYPPLGAANQAVGMVKGALQSVRDAKAAESPQGAVSKLVGVVPVVGQPISDLSQPAVAVSEGRAPSKAENLGALKGGAELATLAAAPKVLARFHGKGTPAEAPAEAPTSAPPAVEPAAEPVIGDEGPRLSGGSEVSGMTKRAPFDVTEHVKNLADADKQAAAEAAFKDKLTGLWNRRAFEEGFGNRGKVAITDLDNFKTEINDKLGHACWR